MKDHRGESDLTVQIEALTKQKEFLQDKCRQAGAEINTLKADLARAKEDHQYDRLVFEKELESLRNPVNKLRDKGLM
jgi:predicted RNase H-like nuclease (RuvC/YqgF family)